MSQDLNNSIESDKQVYNQQLCEICGITFARKYNLNAHTFTKHTINLGFPCCVCSSWFTTKTDLRRHIKVVHFGLRFQCPKCEKRFTRKSHLERHITAVHLGLGFQCPWCEKRFTRKNNLRRHMFSITKACGINSDGKCTS